MQSPSTERRIQIIYQPFTPEMFSWTMTSKGMKLGTVEFYVTDHNV